MAGVGPIPRFQQHRVKHSDLNDFAGDTVNLHPITKPDSVLAHQHEPSQEPDDEVLQRNRKSRSRKTDKSSELRRRTKNHKEDEEERQNLKSHARNGL